MASANNQPRVPNVLTRHYDVPSSVPNGDFKVKCKYCVKEKTGSVKSTSNWWKHLVSYIYIYLKGNHSVFVQRQAHAQMLKTESASSTQQSLTNFAN